MVPTSAVAVPEDEVPVASEVSVLVLDDEPNSMLTVDRGISVVMEGDLRDRLNAPVKQGDALFKVARLQTLYVEAEIDERDVHEVLGRTNGEIAFVSQPKLTYPVQITRIEPAAMPKKDGNFFRIRCTFRGDAQPWWRPGMSGVCKLSVEKRSLYWIISHRTVDFLRLKLWW